MAVVHGACPSGADAIASWWVKRYKHLSITEEPHPADWDMCDADCPQKPHRFTKRAGDNAHPGKLDDYCPKAGPRRNAKMVALGADLCLAFLGLCARPRCWHPKPHGSHGAVGTAVKAEQAGIRLVAYAVIPDGAGIARLDLSTDTPLLKVRLDELYGRVTA